MVHRHRLWNLYSHFAQCFIFYLILFLYYTFCFTCAWFVVKLDYRYVIRVQTSRGGVGVNQAYSRFSTTHSHITDCKLDSVGYVGVCVVI